jgi:bifunctional UDP-N-acetylglucosamine pyrophosphorylase/glucosamine-1-phosphate N-acetyltransferase
VLHPLAGRSLIEHVLGTADHLDAEETVIVVGHGADAVRDALVDRDGLNFVVQSPQLGTGHAVLQTEPVLKGRTGTMLLLYGDVPLLQSTSLNRLLETHRAARADVTVLTADLADPYGYGRIVRDDSGGIVRIVEERDASAAIRQITEINSGIYALELEPLFDALHQLATDNSQGEYYLTDLVSLYHRQGRRLAALCLESPAELRGVNSRADLAELTGVLRQRKNRSLMLGGVTLEDPATTYVDQDVVIGTDTIIGPGVRLEGKSVIGSSCRLHAGVRLTNATLADRVTVLDWSIIVQSTIDAGASVGPFAHIRPDSTVGPNARVGNFVELKKTVLGAGSKASHLSYLGDATIGADVNIGAGTITCNYDGVKKHQTVLEDGVFVGSNSQLVAPVRIGKGAYVAAGSTVTHDVPADALAVARSHQENKKDWAVRRRAKQQAEQAERAEKAKKA